MADGKTLKTLRAFFPQDGYTEESVTGGLENGDVIINPSLLVNYLQGALHDESLLEVELGNLTRVFFCRILDHPPEEEPEDAAEEPEESVPYSKGDYLNKLEYIILTPLEPSEGNYLINSSPRVLLRALTSQAAIEFCCYYTMREKVGKMPVLQVSFPAVARQIEGAREYRVKVPGDMDLKIIVKKKGSKLKFTTRAMDMGMNGMSLYDPMGKDTQLKTDDKLSFEIVSGDMITLTVNAVVRHVTRLRDAKGLQYVFGVQLDLESRALAAEVEKTVAGIQRARLRELGGLEDEFGLNLSDW